MQFGSAPLFLLLFLFLDCKHSKKKNEKDAAFMVTPTCDSARDGAHQSIFAGRGTWKNSWWVSLNLINQACVSVGVELKKHPSEPGPLQNAAHLCFRLQAVSCSALTLAARPAPCFSFPRFPCCKQFAMNFFKTDWFETIRTRYLFIFSPVESNN